MKLGPCRITRCDQPAEWTVTIDGHPNVQGVLTGNYCRDHVAEKTTVWTDSPAPYTTSVRGPFKASA